MVKKSQSKILIVEDDNFLADIYKTKLELEGYKVLLTSDGEKGLKIIQTKKPDLVLLDVLLPKLDGFAILEIIKKEDSVVKEVPIILLTNLGQKEEVQKGLRLGAADYLIKAHFKPAEVIEKIKKILNK
ncbi:MAG TPA: response regulator [Candidatus Magasanikbacteria bacterium]|nr:response regulator [Candidatus Magasanikbacteria bacterium]